MSDNGGTASSYAIAGTATSSYATVGITLWIIAPCKPPYPAKGVFVKVEILQGGISLLMLLIISNLVSFYLTKNLQTKDNIRKMLYFFGLLRQT
jgi:hypothetical protein